MSIASAIISAGTLLFLTSASSSSGYPNFFNSGVLKAVNTSGVITAAGQMAFTRIEREAASGRKHRAKCTTPALAVA